MGARRSSRLIASAVAIATFSTVTAVPSSFAAEDNTTFVEEKTTDNTVDVNGIEFDEDGHLLEESNAGDEALDELEAETDESVVDSEDEESSKPSSLAELKQSAASNEDVNIKVLQDEKKGKLVCEVTDAPGKEGNLLGLKLALAKSFYDGGEQILETVWELLPVVGDVVPAEFMEKISGLTWEGIEKLVRKGEQNKTVTWDLSRAQGMAIGRIDNADADVDLKDPEAAKRTVSGLIKFADGVFGSGAKTVLQLFNVAVTVAGLVPGAGAANHLKLSAQQQKAIADSLGTISERASDLAAVNAPAGQMCSDMLNGKEVSAQSTSDHNAESAAASAASTATAAASAEEESESSSSTSESTSEELSEEEPVSQGTAEASEPKNDDEDVQEATDEAESTAQAEDDEASIEADEDDSDADDADADDGKEEESQAHKASKAPSANGFSLASALVGGGTVLGLLSVGDYLYKHGYLSKNSLPWNK
ncbi:hypothetical protein [Corynebacterium accolens]|uniref:Uncharacterized protein n=1 Tax=Corynebacterium accolens TaxID=38284 RepID=A0ABT7FQI9_9CORY|nr:hypothetical protein [Corynebacterium accolens]MDK4247863.1 hypothetical protein [Corynebacterium accolens]MDK4267556.1 hypothetical protein [Corynebacterium accolens]MDK4308963.1 hypothetical protein [Corynebacterium accolens]MDK4323860.1 hypothetical protein [Corynebacterium accolens]MDK8681002.1 hypothetical protein [Corynebacterium accolens]